METRKVIDDMYKETIYDPSIIEERLSGRVYAVYTDAEDGITVKCIVLNSRKDINEGIESLVNILEKKVLN